MEDSTSAMPGKIPCIHGFVQAVQLILIGAFQVPVVRTGIFHHFIYVGPVLAGLEGIGTKVAVIIHKVKGKGI